MKKTLFKSKPTLNPAPFDIQSGRLTQATWLASHNFNDRPEGTDISAIVIHNISLPLTSLKKRMPMDCITSSSFHQYLGLGGAPLFQNH